MRELGKPLIILGLAIAVLGLVLVGGDRLHLPFGRLPGDFSYRGKNISVYLPLGTSIVLSVLLSLIFWLFRRK